MNAALKLMTPDDFLDWCQYQEDRWELVNGVPIRMMTGTTQRHDEVVVNLIAELRDRLKGKPCRPRTADVAARMEQGNIRRPDVTVDCGPTVPKALASSAPTVVFEVLSPSTRTTDLLKKTAEYKAVPTLCHIALIEPDVARVWLWSRSDATMPWVEAEIEGFEAEIHLTALGISLPMAAVYDRVEFEG